MKLLSQLVFWGFFITVFLLEGTGFPNGRVSAYFLVLSMPFFLFFLDVIRKEPIQLPKKLTILFLLFFTFLAVSTIFSTDIQNSFEKTLYYIAVFLTFIYVYNHQKELIKKIEPALIFLGIFFSLYSLFVSRFFSQYYLTFWNFAEIGLYSHNKLGDFLGIVLVIVLWRFLQTRKIIFLALFSFLFYFFVFSFSRTAYLSFFIIAAFILIKNRETVAKKYILFASCLLIFTFVFFLFITKDFKDMIGENWFTRTISKNFNYQYKPFISSRDQYFLWAFKTIRDMPFIGVGPGNFMNAAARYTQIPLGLSQSSMNIFLDFFAEGGIFTGFLFILMLLYFLRRISFQPAVYYLVLNFQTYWFHLYYSIFLLFFILIGIYLKKDKTWTVSIKKIISTSFFIFILIFPMILSEIYYQNFDYKKAFIVYPLNKKAISAYAGEELRKGDKLAGFKHLRLLEKLALGNSGFLNSIGDQYLRYCQPEKALAIFKQANLWGPFSLEKGNIEKAVPGRNLVVRKIYELEKKLHGQKEADKFFNSYMEKFQKIKKRADVYILNETKTMCDAIYAKCPYKL